MKVPRRTFWLALAGATALVLELGGTVAAQTLETGPIKVTDSGSITPNGYALKGVTGTANNAGLFGYGNVSSSNINIDGVVGYVQTQQSVGVVGWAQSTSTSAYGVYGYSATGPGVYGYNNNGAAASIYGYNTSSGGVAMYGNSSFGYGVLGSSGASHGVVGMTTTTSGTGLAGVVGVDQASVSGNDGVMGQSHLGSAVAGYNVGTSTGDALFALSTAGSDAFDSYQFGNGMFADYSYADASFFDGYFEGGSNTSVVLYAYSDASGAAFAAGVDDGVGASVDGASGNPEFPAFQAYEGAIGTYPFATYNGYDSGGGPGPNDETFIINDSSNYSKTYQGVQVNPPNAEDVQVSGDLYVQGDIWSLCSNEPSVQGPGFPVTGTGGATCLRQPGANVKRTSSGANVKTYNANESLPIMEDFGEAQLVNGQASVPLERTFASTIDTKRPYLVFITPEGECNVLYVATKTPAGFVVREVKGGRSTLAFQYRIVAHPFGDFSPRLAVVRTSHNDFARHTGILRKTDPHSKTMLAVFAKSKSMRAAAAHRFPQRVQAPQKSALPLVNPALFRQ